MMNRNAIVINILCKPKLKIKGTFFPLTKKQDSESFAPNPVLYFPVFY